mgnify:CR=1 FL=1
MRRLAVRAGVIWIAALAAACAGFEMAPQDPPSPRPECNDASVTIYFPEESATLQPLADPLLTQLMQRVNACQGAGGELREIRIVAYPDSGANRSMREAEMRMRGARVRAALVAAGAPEDKIRVVRPRGDLRQVMQRRAEVTADLF